LRSAFRGGKTWKGGEGADPARGKKGKPELLQGVVESSVSCEVPSGNRRGGSRGGGRHAATFFRHGQAAKPLTSQRKGLVVEGKRLFRKRSRKKPGGEDYIVPPKENEKKTHNLTTDA